MPVKLLFEAKQQQQKKKNNNNKKTHTHAHTLNKQDKAGVFFPPNFDFEVICCCSIVLFFQEPASFV